MKLLQTLSNIKIAKKNTKTRTLLVNSLIGKESSLEETLKKGEYIATKSQNMPDEMNSRSYEINLLYYGGGTAEKLLVWKDKLSQGPLQPKHKYWTSKADFY